MIDYEKKGFFNLHTLLVNDNTNLSNHDNKHIYGQLMAGNLESPSLNYLLNLNKQNLNDYRSIMFYNSSNLASFINEAKQAEDILDYKTIYLNPVKKKIKNKFLEIITHRRSTRQFIWEQMDFISFSTIMNYSFGIGSRKHIYDDVIAKTRFYSSGGGLYPIVVYIFINNVIGIPSGIYLYQPYSHSIYPLVVDYIDPNSFFVGDGIDVSNMCFSVFFEYSLNKNFVKYGELALLNTFVEVGGMSHNFDLVCEASHFTSCPIAGFNKSNIEKLLDIDGINDHIIFSNICGKD